jgi:hypothetical protein
VLDAANLAALRKGRASLLSPTFCMRGVHSMHGIEGLGSASTLTWKAQSHDI